ncbi:MAG: monooxygenase [Spirochaeta sp.]|nr:monooxygenase [Spirochaeta sp.]RPG11480.1 MAG: NAD(P)/FAD-dependent oxidoreductase [Proteobacteria bacterium TMED72]
MKDLRKSRFVIIGAGMSGILTAIKLAESGYDDFVVYEKADRLGGTWRENRYAGVACDVPSHFYSYSFALNPSWSRRFSPGAEIQSYFEKVAEDFGVTSRIRFGSEVTRCHFEAGRWEIELADGSRDQARFIVAATGVLHEPFVPDFEGLEDFEGDSFHTARWDDSLSLKGKRVGLVGTGSSSIQILPAIVEEVDTVTLFQRTPQWILPIDNTAYTQEEKQAFETEPALMQTLRDETAEMMIDGFANILIDADSPALKAVHDTCEANLNESVKDPELREKLRPDYRAACKRLIMSEGFYDGIQRPNAKLETGAIDGFEAGGIRTQDGRLHELDVIILATGFKVDAFVRPMEVTGWDGVALDGIWQEGPRAYMAISVPQIPNFFMLNGPNSPVGNFSLIEIAELQVAYILALLEQLGEVGGTEVASTPEAMSRFDRERREAAKKTIWNSGCRSWYLDSSGLPTAWPWTFDRFQEEMQAPRMADYEVR